MRQLYSAKNGLEAHDLRLFLESHGIEAKVFGGNNALEIGFAFTPSSAPGVYVDEKDFDQASSLLEQFYDHSNDSRPAGQWTCAGCGQNVEAQFDTCWKCESPRGELPLAFALPPDPSAIAGEPLMSDSPTSNSQPAAIDISCVNVAAESKAAVWFELATVLSVAWFPYFAYSLSPESGIGEDRGRSFAANGIWFILNSVPICVVVLYVMSRSGSSWAEFGIKRPRIVLDPFTGVVIWFTTVTALAVLNGIAAIAIGPAQVSALGSSTYEFQYPSTATDYALVLLLAAAVGFSEELAMRGYLIPRLEHLLNSTPKSVLISSLIFASYHLYQGIGSTVWIFLTGLSFGCAYCWVRRLWPLAIAHAIMDVIAFCIPQ
jgi:membrane protease YdiL (CAAX protease family)